MNSLPLVSIALASYNGEKFIQELLDSLISQTYKNIEIVVSDDCSKDGTLEILNRYPSVKVLKNEANLGFVKNFENALKETKGDYIALCDQDDVWLPEKIETLVKEIGDNSLIHSEAYLIDEDGKTISNTASSKVKRFLQNKSFLDYLKTNSVIGCTSMITKELRDAALPFPKDAPYHDWWLAICASKTGTIKYLDTPLIKYRYHASNASFNYYKSKKVFVKKSKNFYKEIYERFKPFLSFRERLILKSYTMYFFIFSRLLIKLGVFSPKNKGNAK